MSLERLKELGFHVVHEAEGLLRVERVLSHGTQRLEGTDAEDVLAQVDAHPGAAGTDISRSDGASEVRDVQEAHSAQVGPSDLPTPAADAAAAAAAEPAAEPAEEPAPAAEVPAEAPAAEEAPSA